MFWFIVVVSCTFHSTISLTLALTIPSIQDLTNPKPPPLATNKTLPELTSLTLDVPALTLDFSLDARVSPAPVCNGDLLGFDMNRYSCLQAWNTIPTSYQDESFGDRGGGFNVELPRRFSGPDGTCVIDIFHNHKDGVVSDATSYRWISKAAEKLYGTCVAQGQRTQGGYIRDIGQDKNLVVVLSAYSPSVSCFSKRLAIRDKTLQTLLSLVPVTTDQQTFGPEGEPGVQIVLPIVHDVPASAASLSRGVRLTIDVEHRNTVTARWFDIWAGAVAVAAMCANRGYAGISGLPGGLGVSLEAMTGPALGGGNGTAAS